VLGDLLGAGGFGAVYRARHEVLGHEVALKLLHSEHAADGETLERFFREARAATAIGNRHIVMVHDCGTSPEGWPFLAMELLDGAALEEVIYGPAHAAPLTVERALDIALQTLEGLAAAHVAGIIHRDLKPANIFLARDAATGAEVVKILDFGVSKVTGGDEPAMTQAGAMLGTPLYMAPEQFHNARDVDHRVDLYSAAAVLYEMLAGRPPFDAPTYADLVVQICCEAVKPLTAVAPHVPPRLAAAVMRGLALAPEARWSDAATFAAALCEASGRATPSAPPGAVGGFASGPAPAPAAGGGAPTVPPPLGAKVVGGRSPASTPGFPTVGSGSAQPTPPAPPPPAPGATGRHRAVWAGLAAIVLLCAVGGGLAAWAVLRADSASPSAPPPALGGSPPAAPSPVPPAHTPGAPIPAAPAQPAPAPPPLGSVADPFGQLVDTVLGTVGEGIVGGPPPLPEQDPATGVTLFEPRGVGQIDLAAVRQALVAARPGFAACRPPASPVTVRLRATVTSGHLVALEPSSTNTAPPTAAACVSGALQRVLPAGWSPGQGVVFLEVALASRAPAGG
jgi:serine/threonine-protein kinase